MSSSPSSSSWYSQWAEKKDGTIVRVSTDNLVVFLFIMESSPGSTLRLDEFGIIDRSSGLIKGLDCFVWLFVLVVLTGGGGDVVGANLYMLEDEQEDLSYSAGPYVTQTVGFSTWNCTDFDI